MNGRLDNDSERPKCWRDLLGDFAGYVVNGEGLRDFVKAFSVGAVVPSERPEQKDSQRMIGCVELSLAGLVQVLTQEPSISAVIATDAGSRIITGNGAIANLRSWYDGLRVRYSPVEIPQNYNSHIQK